MEGTLLEDKERYMIDLDNVSVLWLNVFSSRQVL